MGYGDDIMITAYAMNLKKNFQKDKLQQEMLKRNKLITQQFMITTPIQQIVEKLI